MKRVCYYCQQIFGEKKPLSNHEETSGECDLCHWLFTLWYALHQEGMTSETATEFILDCRKAFQEVDQNPTLECDLTGPQTFDHLPGGVEPLQSPVGLADSLPVQGVDARS